MQRNTHENDDVDKFLDEIENIGDREGYKCVGPKVSFRHGSNRFSNGLRLFVHAPECYYLDKKIEKISTDKSLNFF